MKNIFNHNPLFAIFFLPIIFDVVGTVLGQPPEFWTTNHQVFSEALPIYPLLQFSPLLFIVICLGFWLPFTYWLTKKLKSPLNLWAAMALFGGHGYNSVAWLRINVRQFGFFPGTDQTSQVMGLIPMTLYILLISYIAMIGINKYLAKSNRK